MRQEFLGEIYKSNGERIVLLDLADWWNRKYPGDIFTGTTIEMEEIVTIRNAFHRIKQKYDAHNKSCKTTGGKK